MIETIIEIAGKTLQCFYEMSAGEVDKLYIQLPSGLVDMTELLEVEEVYSSLADHYANLEY